MDYSNIKAYVDILSYVGGLGFSLLFASLIVRSIAEKFLGWLFELRLRAESRRQFNNRIISRDKWTGTYDDETEDSEES